jgi:hypothetical protein
MTSRSTTGEIWSDAFPSGSTAPLEWIWEGLLAPGNVTLLTSQWKSGKTTLLCVLLGLRIRGGTLGGRAVRPGKTVVICEESIELWAKRAETHGLGGSACFISRPFKGIPTQEEWLELIERVLVIHQDHGVDLLVIDPLAPFLESENDARSMLERLLPLEQLLAPGMAVLLLHHPGKKDRALGQAARGSGALLGHVDVSIEMRHPGGDPMTRRRRLFVFSRHPVSPRLLTLELDEAGTTYSLVPEPTPEPVEDNWETIRLVLAEAEQKLTRQDILMEWPADFEQPAGTTLWRVLDRAVEQGLVQCEGSGRKGDPHRYWLPEREAVWQQDPLYALIQAQRAELKLPFVSLAERKERLRQAGADTGGPTERLDERNET